MVSEVACERGSLLRGGSPEVEIATADQRARLRPQRHRQDAEQPSFSCDRDRAGGEGKSVGESAPPVAHGRNEGRPDQRKGILELLRTPDRLPEERRGSFVVTRELGRYTAQRGHTEPIGLA